MLRLLFDFQRNMGSHKFQIELECIFAHIYPIPEKLCELMNFHCNTVKYNNFGLDFEFWKKISVCLINCLICYFRAPHANGAIFGPFCYDMGLGKSIFS
jgi:hypothetical protein